MRQDGGGGVFTLWPCGTLGGPASRCRRREAAAPEKSLAVRRRGGGGGGGGQDSTLDAFKPGLDAQTRSVGGFLGFRTTCLVWASLTLLIFLRLMAGTQTRQDRSEFLGLWRFSLWPKLALV